MDSGTGPNFIRSEVLPIGWRKHLLTSSHVPRLDDANDRMLERLVVVLLRIMLSYSPLQGPFIIFTQLEASMIIETEFLAPHVPAIRCMRGIV